jgi:chromosome segregation ATPase
MEHKPMTIDLNEAAQSALHLVEQFRALESVGNALRDLGSLDNHKRELDAEIAKLKREIEHQRDALTVARRDAEAETTKLARDRDAMLAEIERIKSEHTSLSEIKTRVENDIASLRRKFA